jgi:hypothetical protein
MKVLDTPIVFDRTLRELIVVGGGLIICAMEIARDGTNPWHLGVFVAGTGLLAVRFFAARVVAIGVLLSAIAAHFSGARYGDGWVPTELHWGVYAMAAGVLLLMSRDLAQRFDFAQSGPGWRLNRWRDLPRAHWRASTLLGWWLGILGHFLLRGWQGAGDAAPSWPLYAIVACIACVFLLFTGRSIVFVFAAALGIAVTLAVWPHVGAAEAMLDQAWATPPTELMWRARPDSAMVATVSAAGTAIVSLPYAVLHLWHGLRRA